MLPSTHKPLLVNIRAATELIGVSRSSIYRMVDRGALSPVKVGARTLFRVSDLEALAASGEVRQ